ncbi:hypothetical protein SAMN02745217_01714 [Anaerocolumna xylanovorans DSM 12503]|uniref:Uncharacterized protein n=1 Tax=Anaerocolumna xylanovorans DSM 12503 TaxID=1121345 RepID=A0A1M7Y6Q6_9FIRM|nr:hypothetical protein SAMN02745217_01714 [Anaerocolumna xylanovorans DSM 12503]
MVIYSTGNRKNIQMIIYNAIKNIYFNKIFVNFIHKHVNEWYNNVKLNNER